MKSLLQYIRHNKKAILIVCIIFSGNPPWMIWKFSVYLTYLFSIILFYLSYPQIKRLASGVFAVFFFLLFPVYIILPLFLGWHLTNVFILLTFLTCCSLDRNSLFIATKLITKILAYVILLSLPVWLFHVFISPLTPISTVDLSAEKNVVALGKNIVMNNYIFFVTFDSLSEAFRFYSVFDEPGVLGTLGAFILYANKYNFKDWKVSSILIGCFFTYSLAFYVLSFIGMTVMYFNKPKRLIGISLIITIIIIGAYSYLQDDLAFQQAVVTRIFDNSMEDNMDSRSSVQVDNIYNKRLQNLSIIVGIGNNEMIRQKLLEGSSYKHFILEYGILGLIAMLIAYRILMGRKPNRYCWGAYLLVFLSFLQRPQIWSVKQMILFCCVIACVGNAYQNTKQIRRSYNI